MKIITKFINLILTMVILIMLIASIGASVFHHPVFLTVIKSNSMYPLWERGDILVINHLSEDDAIRPGDIVLFKSEEGTLASKGWIAHRVTGGNSNKGFITKGDANEASDQALDQAPPIKREWITAKVATIAEQPMVIPRIGYLNLWMQNMENARLVMPIIALLLAGIIAYGEVFEQKRGKRKHKLDRQLIYIGSGFTMCLMAAAAMLMMTQFITLRYEVSEDQGLLSGSDIGMLRMGDVKSGRLSVLENSSFVPLIGFVENNDPQIQLNHRSFILTSDESMAIKYTVTAKHKGRYQTSLKVALFYPLLPAPILYKLATINYWLALFCVSIIPGLPFIAYPLINRRMRRSMIKQCKRSWKKLKRRWL
ncbi:signal peptidase I [Tuberibacillus sp. Marseille-P3662]|uniref:signal peptidase I n=1 Tax=Tuberibacillus sp. Marseille-P3662 TaxID=1965358 RepID=UPI000A1CCCF5|nr:signal peptidase I [Tuberibacillus sp. Marseille-P3662]